MSDKKRIEQLEATLRGVLAYVKASNPRSLSQRDQEAKMLVILFIETALNPPEPATVEIQASKVNGAHGFVHPLNPKMGEVVP